MQPFIGGFLGFRVSPRFYPIRLGAYMQNNTELSIEIENTGEQPCWTECDVIVPEALSLAPDRELSKGRVRIGIINASETLGGKCKIYAGPKSYPDIYEIRLVLYGFGKDGVILQREEKKTEIRCEHLGK
ncbi:MAG: hypothetical protein ABIG39_04065 [Candidatus Micrarchaeota archaeon]